MSAALLPGILVSNPGYKWLVTCSVHLNISQQQSIWNPASYIVPDVSVSILGYTVRVYTCRYIRTSVSDKVYEDLSATPFTSVSVSNLGYNSLSFQMFRSILVADRYSLVYTLGERLLYTGLLTDIPGSSAAYRSLYTLLLTNIPIYTRPLYPRLQTNILGNSVADWYSYTLPLTGIQVCTPGDMQCSLEILLYFVADRHSGPGERLLYPKLQTDTLGYNVADMSLYTLSVTYIPVYT